jgi:hypothetical protein
MPIPDIFDWITLTIFCLLTTMFLYEAWVNLIDHKVSRFSLDTLIVYILQRVGTKKTKQNAKVFPRNKTEIILIGIWVFGAGLKGIQEIVIWIDKFKP